ncbi:hypothetical protein [Pseudomonas serbica]|jgi:hypothetical protein|uniref:hypothetical protein n=1 Tax=Pseudomonas serbica TaxID=2965074 RepID=UPI00237BBF02|nr:hypothetical protein [Pseudomonas serbica]
MGSGHFFAFEHFGTGWAIFAVYFFALMGYCFYESQRLPSCFPTGRFDYRIPIGTLGIIFLCHYSTFFLGVMILTPMAFGIFPGMIYQSIKTTRLMRAGRVNKLSLIEHRKADDLEFSINNLIHNVGRPYQASKEATEEGLLEIKNKAKQAAKYFFTLTGKDIEQDIDKWLDRRWDADESPKPDAA